MKNDKNAGETPAPARNAPDPATPAPSFELAMKRLSEIVEQLESGELPLDQSLRLFEEGVGLSKTAGGLLEAAERKVEALTRAANGSLGTVSTGIPYSISVPQYTIDPAQKHGNQCLIDPKDPKPCGPTVPETNRLWWDVFPIPSGNTFYAGANATSVDVPGYFKMRSRFVDFSGYYVMHCHILAHKDRGMMTVVEVTPLQSPYSHH